MADSREEMKAKLTADYHNQQQQECVVLAVWNDDTEFVIHAYNPVWGDFEIVKQTFSLKAFEKGLRAGSKILCTRKVTKNDDARYTLDSNLDYEKLKQDFNAYYNAKMHLAVYNKLNENVYSI